MMTFTDAEGRVEHRIYPNMVPPITFYDSANVKCTLRNGAEVIRFMKGPEYPFRDGMEEFNPTEKEMQDAPKKDAINPDHYKSYMVVDTGEDAIVTLQWMEAQQYKPYWRANPRAFVQAVLLQADKYLSRMGKKDDETQEMLKALWYTKFAAAFMKNGLSPIWIEEIDTTLEMGPESNVRNNQYIDKATEENRREMESVFQNKYRLLIKYVQNTVDGYNDAEWSEGGFTKEEIEELREYAKSKK
jgi:hypothetical protein